MWNKPKPCNFSLSSNSLIVDADLFFPPFWFRSWPWCKEQFKKGRTKNKEALLKTQKTQEKNRTARQAVTFKKSKSCQAQSTSQFSLPLVPEAENRQPAAKYPGVFWSPSPSAKKGMWKSHLYDLLKQFPELWLWIMASSEGAQNPQRQ